MVSLREFAHVAFWKSVRRVRRCREECCHEWLMHLGHLIAVKLHEFLVPDGPRAVEVVVTMIARVLVVFRSSEVILETAAVGECLKSHRAVHCSVEECRFISLVGR